MDVREEASEIRAVTDLGQTPRSRVVELLPGRKVDEQAVLAELVVVRNEITLLFPGLTETPQLEGAVVLPFEIRCDLGTGPGLEVVVLAK